MNEVLVLYSTPIGTGGQSQRHMYVDMVLKRKVEILLAFNVNIGFAESYDGADMGKLFAESRERNIGVIFVVDENFLEKRKLMGNKSGVELEIEGAERSNVCHAYLYNMNFATDSQIAEAQTLLSIRPNIPCYTENDLYGADVLILRSLEGEELAIPARSGVWDRLGVRGPRP